MTSGVSMTWEQRYRMRQTARTSLVFWAGIALVAGVIAAPAERSIDHETGWTMFNFSPDGARAVLGDWRVGIMTAIASSRGQQSG